MILTSSHRLLLASLILGGCLSASAQMTVGNVYTVAGNGTPGYIDNATITSTEVNGPYGLAIDPSGNIYIADTNNRVVRKVSASGVVTTFAGNGNPGGPISVTDGQQATAAELGNPFSLALDAGNNLLIGDSGYIWKVTPAGVITKFAGSGSASHPSDGTPATQAGISKVFGMNFDSSGNLFFTSADTYVYKVTPQGLISTVAGTGSIGNSGDGGPATSAMFDVPGAVALDAVNNIYVLDLAYSRIREIDHASGVITAFAGTGSCGFSGDGSAAQSASICAFGMQFDNFGNLFLADGNNLRIREITTDGNIHTYAGTGTANYNGENVPATSANISRALGVALDVSGNVYFSDAGNARVREIYNPQPVGCTTTSGVICTIAGNGIPGFSGDGGPAISASLNLSRPIGSQPGDNGGTAVSAFLHGSQGIFVDSRNYIFIGDTENSRVRKIAPNGSIQTIAGNGIHAADIGDNLSPTTVNKLSGRNFRGQHWKHLHFRFFR